MIQNIKTFRACLLTVLASVAAMAQTATQNYTKTTTYREAGAEGPPFPSPTMTGSGAPYSSAPTPCQPPERTS